MITNMAGIVTIAYLTAGVLFIRALAGLSKQETARRGNRSGMIGMGVAVTVAGPDGLDTGGL